MGAGQSAPAWGRAGQETSGQAGRAPAAPGTARQAGRPAGRQQAGRPAGRQQAGKRGCAARRAHHTTRAPVQASPIFWGEAQSEKGRAVEATGTPNWSRSCWRSWRAWRVRSAAVRDGRWPGAAARAPTRAAAASASAAAPL